MEPFLHVSLILILCGLVFEYVGYFADLLVIGCESWVCYCGGPPGTRKELQYRRCLSEMVVGDRARWDPSRLIIDGDW